MILANLSKGKGAKPLGLRGKPMTARLQQAVMSYVHEPEIVIFGFFVCNLA